MNMNSYRCCTEPTYKNVNSLSELLKMVSEESRLKLLCILQTGEHCVCEMTEHVKLSQSLISHHLKELKEGGLVVDTKRGLRVYYELTTKGRHIVQSLFKMLDKGVDKK